MKVFIATPTLNYLCSTNFTSSLIKTINSLQKLGIVCVIEFLNNLITPLARDILTDKFLKTDCTHLFFIDSDISWNSDDFIKVLLKTENVHGACYPFKEYKFDKYNPNQTYDNNLQYKLINYVCLKDDNKQNDNSNIVDVINMGTGYMCINRIVLEQLKDKCKTYIYQGIELINYFALTYEDNYLPEDFNFCKLVRENNLKLTVDISVNLTHEGTNIIQGNVIKSSV